MFSGEHVSFPCDDLALQQVIVEASLDLDDLVDNDIITQALSSLALAPAKFHSSNRLLGATGVPQDDETQILECL